MIASRRDAQRVWPTTGHVALPSGPGNTECATCHKAIVRRSDGTFVHLEATR